MNTILCMQKVRLKYAFNPVVIPFYANEIYTSTICALICNQYLENYLLIAGTDCRTAM